ncbi:putative transcription factor C2H2 family [Medicago truncatula]|uniref:RING-type E3 ubiquitin transferase n=1 Tax=Medicago truncatula TaxID=3880 RepID=A0A072V192_MEDTR|nr:probable E3 ubiquitin-protein ligase RHA4A [Medicago truncatula]XP_039687472.1 probable E3 ubiquitin-protein ligase RHA4A [Medicago truncatula]KEH35148.1 RING-H2 zinc finger protein [Medicago truncatula]RHN68997.1 putative transcription factor C2H2 family [Medicago truncatula]
MNVKKYDVMMSSVPQTASSPPTLPHMYSEELQLKLYQAFIFSIPILFSIILFLLFYLFYLKRRASSFSPHLLPRINIPPTTYRYYSSSSPRRLDLTVQFLDKLPRVLFDEDLQARDSLCCVCLGEFEVKEELLQIPYCKHVFHIDCIHHWLQSNSTCPLCRCSIIPTITKFLNPAPPINIIISDPPHQDAINLDSPLPNSSLPDQAGASSNIMSRE